jgi:hypothetical protein
LSKVIDLNSNTKIFRFKLPEATDELNLPVARCAFPSHSPVLRLPLDERRSRPTLFIFLIQRFISHPTVHLPLFSCILYVALGSGLAFI